MIYKLSYTRGLDRFTTHYFYELNCNNKKEALKQAKKQIGSYHLLQGALLSIGNNEHIEPVAEWIKGCVWRYVS